MKFFEYLNKLISENTYCNLCENKVQTLHHIDENRANNHISNLLPVCFSCHTNIPHRRPVEDYIDSRPINTNIVFTKTVRKGKCDIKPRTNKAITKNDYKHIKYATKQCLYVKCRKWFKLKTDNPNQEFCNYLCESKKAKKDFYYLLSIRKPQKTI